MNGQARSTTSSTSPDSSTSSSASTSKRRVEPGSAARREEGDRGGGAGRQPAEHALRRLLGAGDGEHDVEGTGRGVAVVAHRELVDGLARVRVADGVQGACAQVRALIGLLAARARARGRAQQLAAAAVPAEAHLRAERARRRQPLDALGEDEAAADAPRRGLLPHAQLRCLDGGVAARRRDAGEEVEAHPHPLRPGDGGHRPHEGRGARGGRRPALARGELDPQRRSLRVRAGGQREGEDGDEEHDASHGHQGTVLSRCCAYQVR